MFIGKNVKIKVENTVFIIDLVLIIVQNKGLRLYVDNSFNTKFGSFFLSG